MNDTFEFTLESPLTQEQIDLITDVELEHTDKVFFKTPKGKEVVFAKERTGRWIWEPKTEISSDGWKCSACNMEYHTQVPYFEEFNFCPNCGARMRGEEQ